MFEYLKTKLFGSKIFQRTSSVEVRSKYKSEQEQKRPLSIDSKQKEEGIRQTARKREVPEIIEDDSVEYEQKGWTTGTRSFEGEGENLKNFVVSDAGHEEGGFEDLLDGLTEEDEKSSLTYVEETTIGLKGRLIPNHPTSKKMRNCQENIFKNGKVLIKRTPERKAIKRVSEICSVCYTSLSVSDSHQLACTHRCHNSCANGLRDRLYKCDLCEGRNHKKFRLNKK